MKITMWSGVLFVCLLLGFPATGAAMDSEECLFCHGEADLVGAEQRIDVELYSHTVHSQMGCLTCHDGISDAHPDDGLPVTASGCLACHEETGQAYAQTRHAQFAECRDCHDPHRGRGLEAVSGPGKNQQCSQCHDLNEIAAGHSQWLPQADLHIGVLPCITCHTSSPGYEIVLNITRKQDRGMFGAYDFASYTELQELNDGQAPAGLIDINGDAFISLAELRTFNRNPAYADMRLEGTLVPSQVSHDLSTLDSRYDCTFCHVSGPQSMQTSFLALPRPEGIYEQIAVEEGAVLDALYGTPDFYLTGSTRSASMNLIGLIIICCGLIMPIGHGTLRFLTRKNRQHKGE